MTQPDFRAILDSPIFRTNTARDLGEAVLLFAGAMALLWIVKIWAVRLLRKAAAKTTTAVDDFFIEVFDRAVLPILYAGAGYLALGYLDLPAIAGRIVDSVFKGILIFQAVRALLSVATFFIRNSWASRSAGADHVAARSVLTILRILVWGIAALFLLDNLGFDVNAVIAGLGIGGVAVALAAQTILGDLFNYFVIILDQPFVEGDFIVVDEFKGEIEKIGIKSTRIRSLDGDLLIVSNSNLMSSRIRNFKRMAKRRALFTLGVVYQTPIEKVRRISEMVRAVIQEQPKTQFDRAHFKSFGGSSLDFEVVYFVLDPDYTVYMDIQQKINLEVMKRFLDEGIDFAYPTQTVYNYGEIPLPKLVKN